MQLFRNKASGKYFIYIDPIGVTNMGLFVTPIGEIKPLEFHLFDEPVERDEYPILSRGLVTNLQVCRYQEYEQNRQEDVDMRKKERAKKYTYRQLIQKVRQLPPDKLRRLRELLEAQV